MSLIAGGNACHLRHDSYDIHPQRAYDDELFDGRLDPLILVRFGGERVVRVVSGSHSPMVHGVRQGHSERVFQG